MSILRDFNVGLECARTLTNQAGFRRGMSCLDQLHTLRRIMEGTRDKNLAYMFTFVDFTKAFNSINREVM